jgi:hypothetical protein
MAGHSFVRRSTRQLLPEFPHQNRDITSNYWAEQLADSYKVSYRCHRIFTVSNQSHSSPKVVYISHLLDRVQEIMSYSPSMVLVDCLSNELSRLTDQHHISDVWAIALRIRDLVSRFPPHVTVICMGVVPRVSGIASSIPMFRYYARYLNLYLKHIEDLAITSSQPPLNFRYHAMQGWDYIRGDDGQPYELPTSTWMDAQGIHPTPEAFAHKYRRTVKKAILDRKNFNQ